MKVLKLFLVAVLVILGRLPRKQRLSAHFDWAIAVRQKPPNKGVNVLVKIPAVIHNAFRTPILLIKELEPDYKGWVAFRRLIADKPKPPAQEKKP